MKLRYGKVSRYALTCERTPTARTPEYVRDDNELHEIAQVGPRHGLLLTHVTINFALYSARCATRTAKRSAHESAVQPSLRSSSLLEEFLLVTCVEFLDLRRVI